MADAERSKPVWQIQRMAEELLVGDAQLALPSPLHTAKHGRACVGGVSTWRKSICCHVSIFFFLLMWRCLPIGQLLGCNGGHMRRSARVSDTDGLLFSSDFAFRRWHWQSESFSRCITGSPQIPVFLPWSLSYSWFSQLRQLPSFLIALVLSQKKKDQWIIILV